MRLRATILALFVYCTGFAAGADSASLHRACRQLNAALITRDSAALRVLLHEQLHYGHSNGWIEDKRAVIGHLFDGRLEYQQIKEEGLDMELTGNTACVRSTAQVAVRLNGKPIELKLHVLQVWINEKGSWQLLGRQSTKID